MADRRPIGGRITGALLCVVLLAMPGCKPAEQQSAPAPEVTPEKSPSDLEQAALQSGAIVDARSLSPIGLYRNRHEAGTDALCIVPDAGKPASMRFGIEAVFGENAQCSGHGSVRRAGERLIFHFARSTCLIVASYEGDRVVLPGALDVKCEQLCTSRGSLEGVAYPRVARDARAARDARDRDGDTLCPAD